MFFYKSRLPQIAAQLEERLDDAIVRGAEGIERAAKDRVPVQSGSLRDAIHTEREPEGIYVIAGDNDAFYGHLVEFGTNHTPPRPFLIPALEEQRDDIIRGATTALRALL